jgi:hypothetical protein
MSWAIEMSQTATNNTPSIAKLAYTYLVVDERQLRLLLWGLALFN